MQRPELNVRQNPEAYWYRGKWVIEINVPTSIEVRNTCVAETIKVIPRSGNVLKIVVEKEV